MSIWHFPIRISVWKSTSLYDGRANQRKTRVCRGSTLYSSSSTQLTVVLPLWVHTVLPTTRHKWTRAALIQARQTSTRLTYLERMKGWLHIKTLKTGQPVYLRDLLHYHQPARTLRSSSQLLLYQHATRINFQSKTFSITFSHGTSCLELSVSSYEKFRLYHHHFQGTSENWTVLCCIRHGL